MMQVKTKKRALAARLSKSVELRVWTPTRRCYEAYTPALYGMQAEAVVCADGGQIAGNRVERGAGFKRVIFVQGPRQTEILAHLLGGYRAVTPAVSQNARSNAQQREKFRLSDTFRVVGPVPGFIAVLQTALKSGQSLHARQIADPPLSALTEQRQWLYCQTSGSSGTPKTIRRSPASWMDSFEQNALLFDLTSTDCFATLGHIGHSLTLYATMEACHLGAGLLSAGDQRPATQLAQLRDHHVTVLYATPTQIRLLLRYAEAGDLPDIRWVLCGGGFLDDALRDDLAQMCPNAEIRAFFGASETSFVTLSDDATPAGSVGRAYPGVRLRVDQKGEIWVASPYLFDDYACGTAHETTRDGAFLSFGELGHLDAQGYLFLHGRASRAVNCADQLVHPDAVERLIQKHIGSVPCAVIAIEDDLRGHHLVALIVSPEALDPDLEAQLRQVIRTTLGKASVPRRFEPIAEMPLLPSGKPDLAKLRHQVWGR